MSTTTAPQIPAGREDPTALDVSVVIPCLDEAESIESCVLAAQIALADGDYGGEVVVVDADERIPTPS